MLPTLLTSPATPPSTNDGLYDDDPVAYYNLLWTPPEADGMAEQLASDYGLPLDYVLENL